MDRDVFARRCSAITAESPTSQIRQVLRAAGIDHRDAGDLARKIARRGYSPGYLAGWIYQRAHLPTPELVGAIRAMQNLERAPRLTLPVGPRDDQMAARVAGLLDHLTRRLASRECPFYDDPDRDLELRRRASMLALRVWGGAA